jgi:DNA polymerase
MDAHLTPSVYDDINHFLCYLKQMGATGVDIAPSLLKRVEQWGQKKHQKTQFIKPSIRIPETSVSEKKVETESDPYDRMTAILKTVKTCSKCSLHKTRKQIVFGAGDIRARIVFVGEAPGYEEDQTGKPFVGAAGQLLTRIIHAMHLNRDMVYICNILKCRPPDNRTPNAEEIAQCFSYLEQQLDIIQPKIICTMGSTASQVLLKEKKSISSLRGSFVMYKGIKVMPTFHPSYLLRNESKKKEVWKDMQMIMQEMQLMK